MSEQEIYYGTYCRLDTTSGSSHIAVDGNTVVVAAELMMTPQTHVTDRGKEVERIVLSRGDMAMGFLPESIYKKVAKLLDKGWTCRAFSSAAVFNKLEDSYWCEAAIICYRPQDTEAFQNFVDGVVARMAKGEHPAVALSPKEAAQVVETNGAWRGNKSQKPPKLEKGSAYYKTKRTMTENMAIAAAEGNKGCYAGLFIVVFCIIFSIVWFLFLR